MQQIEKLVSEDGHYCAKCGRAIMCCIRKDGSCYLFCEYCGEGVKGMNTKICPKCHVKLEPDLEDSSELECPVCGYGFRVGVHQFGG